MKIALYHNLTSGGSKREAYEFAKQFARAGHTVHLFYPSTADEQFLPLTSIAHRCFTFELKLVSPIQARLPGLRKYVDLCGLGINLSRLKQLAHQVALKVDSGDYDFVFVHHDHLVQSPYLLRYLKTPSVYYCAEPMRSFYEPAIHRSYQQPRNPLERAQEQWYAPTRWVNQVMIKSLDKNNIQYASLLLTNSFFSAENIYRAYGLRARVVYLGVDTEKFKPLNLSKGNFVLSVGAVAPLKGYDFIIEALGKIPEEKRPRFIIVGNTASRGESLFLNQLAQKRRVELEIRVNVSEQELVRLYDQAQALVYAPVLEPFGLSPVEAMACAAPVVAVKEGGVRESVKDGVTGRLVERVPELFAEALSELLADETAQRKLGCQGRDYVMGFWTWPHAYQRFQRVVTEYLGY